MRLVWSRKKGTEYGLSSRSSRQPPSTMHCRRCAAVPLCAAAAAAELVPNKLVLRGAITAMNDAALRRTAAAPAAMGTEARFSIPLYIDARWLFFHANGSFFNAYTHCS